MGQNIQKKKYKVNRPLFTIKQKKGYDRLMTQRVTMSNQRTIFVRWRQGDKAGEAGGQPRSQDFSFKKMEKPWRRGWGRTYHASRKNKMKY